MAEKTKEHKIKALIIVFAVLLGISLLFLAATLIYNHFVKSPPSLVIVPDNIVTSDEGGDTNSTPSPEDSTESPNTSETDDTDDTDPVDDASGTGDTVDTPGTPTSDDSSDHNTTTPDATAKPPAASETPAAAIYLHSKNPGDNQPFNITNMFPGDKETRYYCVRVSCHDEVTVHFKADIRRGYEKLAEVMKIRITLLDSDELMYDGLMKDMPESVATKLTTRGSATHELYYKITAYLDTSVGNDYMEKDLAADFKWWVEETGKLDPPKTGDSSGIILWLLLAGTSLFIITILLVYKKKVRGEQNE